MAARMANRPAALAAAAAAVVLGPAALLRALDTPARVALLLLFIGAPFCALNAIDAVLGGRGTLAGVGRLVVRGHLKVRAPLRALLSSHPSVSVDLSLSDGRRVAGLGSVTADTSLAALVWRAAARVLVGSRADGHLASLTVESPFVDWTHGDDGCLRLVSLLASVGIVSDAPQAGEPPAPRAAAPASAADKTTTEVVVLKIEGSIDVAGLISVSVVDGSLALPEIVGSALGRSARAHAAAGATALAAAPASLAGEGGAWWMARPGDVPFALALDADAGAVRARGWRVAGGVLLERPVTAAADLTDSLARLLLERLHPFLAAVVAVSAQAGERGGDAAADALDSPPGPISLPMLDPKALLVQEDADAALAARPAGARAARVALWPPGGRLPARSLDVLLNPVAVSVHPVGVAGTLASVLGLATLGSAAGGLFTAAGRRASLTTSPARLTLFRGGVARVRRLDATLTPPGGVPVTLALWGSADAGDAAAFDARVGVPVKALRAGSMAARALAPPGAGDDDVLAVRLTRADRPALDWRAAARELPAALVGGHIAAAAAAAVESSARLADVPWLGAAAGALARRAAATAGAGRPSGLAAPPPNEPFDWEGRLDAAGAWG